MNAEARLGHILFALAFAALGIESLLLGIPVLRLEMWHTGYPDAATVGYVSGAVLLLASVALFVPRLAKAGAGVLALVALLWTAVLHLPYLIPTVTHGTYWSGAAETFAVFGAAWVLAALLPPHGGGSWQRIADRGVPLGRICFGLSLLVFGAMHFVFSDFTASFIPAWIPYRLFLAYATGAAHAAVGLAILSGVVPRLAATLAGLMYASWVVILHIPRTIAAPRDPFEWNGIFVAAALSAGAFLVAASFAKKD
jgi:uncharacterized membrane protein YphA (DoxX/SURF4 family)